MYANYDANYVRDELDLIAYKIAQWGDSDFGGEDAEIQFGDLDWQATRINLEPYIGVPDRWDSGELTASLFRDRETAEWWLQWYENCHDKTIKAMLADD